MDDLTHASFFSGVGGLDMGLERAGWRTVSFSEIDPYASAVLAQRWPRVPNLGDITDLAGDGHSGEPRPSRLQQSAGGRLGHAATATLWSGGFPCQDLSVAGKRAGFAGERSSLAFAFLALAERHRPRFVLLENVPGLLSSHRGKDFGALLDALVQLGYGVGYRVLDARYFGVPQRRRRVFILGDSLGGRAGAERAAEVLSVGSRCRRHPPAGVEAGERVTGGTSVGAVLAREGNGPGHNYPDDHLVSVVGALNDLGHHGWTANAQSVASEHVIPERSSPDPRRMREADGLAGRPHDRDGVADTLNSGGNNGGFRTEPGAHLVAAVHPTLRRGAHGDPGIGRDNDHDRLILGPSGMTDDPLLPLGLDSHRYRCCGNGVVSDVAEWIGLRLAAIEAAA